MSKKLKVFALAFAGVLTLAGCSKVGSVPNNYSDADLDINEDWVDYSVPATSISFEEGEINLVLNKGDSYTYSPSLSPLKATLGSVEWESSDTSVVLIEKGTLTAVGGGEAVITVSSPDDYFDDIHLNVTVVVPLESFSLSASSLNLDYNETSKIEVTYTPADTTQRELVWTVSDESIATVDKGLVTAGKKDGSTKLTVHSPVLGNAYDQVVAIDVIDKTVHVSKVFITKNQVEVSSVDVEVTKELQLNAVIEPDNATHKTVVWSSDNASVASVSETGLIKANEVGTTKVKVAAENNKNAEVTVNVFENIPHTFELSDDLKLDTANVKTKQIEITYKDDGGEIIVPSRPVVKYTSSNPEVATVSTSGVVTAVSKGDAIITVEDTKYLLSGTVNVSVVKGTTGIKLSSTSLSIAPEDEFDLTASVIPSDSDQKDITFEITTGEVLVKEFTVVDNTIHVVAGETAGNVVITAKCGNITATCSVKISNEAGAFESSSAYIVGMSSDEEGGFGDYSKPSWGDARYAFKFTEKTGNQYAIYEWHGLVRFDVGDQWKLREGDTWKNIEEYATDDEGTHQIGRYKLDEGAFAAGQMQALKNDKDEYTNVKVLEEGYYDIYYAYYKDELSPAEGWYDIYVGKHALTLNTSSVKVVVNQTSSVKASLFEGTLLAVVEDDTIAEVTNIASDGTITVRGLAEGTTKLTVSDDANSLECEIKVVDATSLSSYYLIGDFNSWTTGDVNYNLTQVSENEYQITDVTLTTEMGIKVHNPAGEGTWYSNESEYEGHSLDSDGNVHVTTNGVYTVHFYVESDYNNHIYAVKTGGDEPTPTTEVYEMHYGIGESWATVNLEANGEGEYKLLDFELAENTEFVFNLNGTWKHYDQLKLSEFALETFEQAGDNIKVKTGKGGHFNFYVSLNPDESGDYEGKSIWIESAVEPPVSEEYYMHYTLDGTTWLDEDLELNVAGEYKLLDFELTEGAIFLFNLNGLWKKYIDLKLSDDALAIFEASGEDIKVKEGKGGHFNFYVKVSPETEGDYIGKSIWAEPVTPIADEYYITYGLSGEAWTNADLELNGEEGYKILGLPLAENVEFTINMNGDWRHYDQLKLSPFALATFEQSGDNIKVKAGKGGTFNIFVGFEPDESGDYEGKSIWIEDAAPAPTPDTETVYFTNNLGWEHAYAYAFNASEEAIVSWPGESMTYVATNSYGQDVYSYELDIAEYSTIIFNNGEGVQTVDVSLTDFTEYRGYYCDTLEDTKYTVGTYKYELGLAESEVAIQTNESATVQAYTYIGELTVNSSDETVATASASASGLITINATAKEGTATITVTDEAGTSREIAVTTTEEIVATEYEYVFYWTGESKYQDMRNVLIWGWKDGEEGAWYDGAYHYDGYGNKVTLPAKIDHVILVVFANGTTASNANWANKISQSQTCTFTPGTTSDIAITW